jgi:predicted ATPase
VEQELTVNKLRFSQDVLYGRHEEQQIIQGCLNSLIRKKQKQFVCIRGENGVGKTALAMNAVKSLATKSNKNKNTSLIVHGKFEESRKDDPYAGMAGACRHICGEILQLQRGNQADLFETVQKSLRCELDRNDLPFLVCILPELVEIIYDIENTLQQESIKKDHRNQQERVEEAFRVFFRVIGAHFLPVIMVLDNLQWADRASLDLIEVLMTDRENSNLFLLCCCRTEDMTIGEEDDDVKTSMDHARLETVLNMLEHWQNKAREFSYCITDLLIGNLQVNDIHEMLMDLLSTDQNLLGLAKICHQKTHGHVFFVIEYLKSLHERGLLTFNLGMLKWVFDESRIVSQTMVADNVVNRMVEKMEALPSRSAHILQLAALLGSQFDETTLDVVWRGINRETLETEDVWEEESSLGATDYVSETLKTAVEEGLLEAMPNSDSTGYNKYRWTHDNIMEAAFALIPEHKVGILMYDAGDTLASNLNPDDLERNIFVVANLLNEGKDSVGLGETMYYSTKRIRMAELNLLAAKRAVTMSAFPSAVSYAQAGIELLPFDRWECHFGLSLELYSIAAETEAYVGEVDQMNRHCAEVVQCPECSLWDKLRVFNVLVDSIAHQGNIGDASDLCRDLLREVGCKFPQGRISVAIATAVAKRRIRKIVQQLTDEDIANLDELTDPRRIECMRLLDRLITYSFYSDRRRFPLVVFRSLQWTLEFGVCYISPPIFATTAVILTGKLGEFSLGSKLAEQALRLTERIGSNASSARTIQITHSLVLNWTRPARSLLGPLFNGYSTGLKTGDTERSDWLK